MFTLSKTIRDMAEAEKLQVLQNEVDQVFSELMAGPLQRTSLDKELKGAVESLRGSTYWLLQSVGVRVLVLAPGLQRHRFDAFTARKVTRMIWSDAHT